MAVQELASFTDTKKSESIVMGDFCAQRAVDKYSAVQLETLRHRLRRVHVALLCRLYRR